MLLNFKVDIYDLLFILHSSIRPWLKNKLAGRVDVERYTEEDDFWVYRIISDLKSLKRRVVENSVIIIISGIVAFVAGLFSDVAKYLIAVNGLILFFYFISAILRKKRRSDG